MAKKTYINLAGETFVAVLQDTPVVSRNGLDEGLLFTIEDNKGERIGCLSAFISMTTRAVWRHQGQLTPEIVKNLFLRIIPHIPFTPSISVFSEIYPGCVQLYISGSESGYDEKHMAQTVKGGENPYSLVEELAFKGNIDDDQVQRDVLSYLYERHLEDRMSFEDTVHIAKALFIDEDTVFRCLDYLEDDGYIEGTRPSGTPGIFHPKITTKGVRYVRGNFQQIQAGTGVIVMGDYIGNDKITTNVQGDGNQTVVKSTVSNSFNTQVNEKVDALKEAILEDYTGADKDVLVGQVEEIKTLAGDKGNFPKVREILGSVLTRTSEFAQIAALGLEVFKMFTGNP